MTEKRILAIDPGSREVGLYWGPGQSRTLYLYDQNLSKSKQAKVARADRLGQLMMKLSDFIMSKGPFDFAVYEEQFVRGDGATRALYGAVGVIEGVLSAQFIGVMPVPQSTLRKWAQSKVQCFSEKDTKALFRRVVAYYEGVSGVQRMTEHECDACALWHFIQDRGEF